MNRLSLITLILLSAVFSQVKPEIGLRDRTPSTYAFINAHIHVTPKKEISSGTLIIKNGKIINSGKSITIPKDAHVIDLKGQRIYPGFIDLYVDVPTPDTLSPSGSAHWNQRVHPEFTPHKTLLNESTAQSLRKQGFTTGYLIADKGVFRGGSRLVNLNSGNDGELSTMLSTTVIAFEYGGWESVDYPGSLLGSIALIRQTLYDAQWYSQAKTIWNQYPAGNIKPQKDDALEALSAHKSDPYIFYVNDDINALRSIKISNEFKLKLWMVGSGHEYRRINELSQASPFVILPMNFPSAPDVTIAEYAAEVNLRKLRHWDMAPDNAKRLVEGGIPFSITSARLKERSNFKKNLSRSVSRGLDENLALSALTTIPAEKLDVSEYLGTLENGKMANLMICDGNYFDKGSKVASVWIEGEEYSFVQAYEDILLAGKWNFELENNATTFLVSIKRGWGPSSYNGNISTNDTEVTINNFRYEHPFLFFTFDGEELVGLNEGIYRFSGTVDGNDISAGLTFPDGKIVGINVQKINDDEQKDEPEPDDKPEMDSSLSVRYPDGAFGLDSPAPYYDEILIKHASVWTSSDLGILEDTDILIQGGKFKEIGKSLNAGKKALIIDAAGKSVTPGLIDCHSHTALNSVNEGSQSITSEVRIEDVIDPDDINIYRELAGGLTMANLLHGSANAIGGQNGVIKLRWGQNAEGLLMAKAKPGIKFALGENVKQSNWGEKFTTRYPQTRMGVDQIIRDGFSAAVEYHDNMLTHEQLSRKKKNRTIPPRRDLELDALWEIIDGQRQIHCHSYRQDEIMNLTLIADDFGFTVGVFQHVLEGYKVAEYIGRHGAGASTFSDWWAYKFEVYDAIPYNAAIMHDEGVVVSLNSDSSELARRMNLEAAKAVKYGGVDREDALKMVTLYPAIQLEIDQYVGSIELGKDADFVIWSGDPLSVYSKCEQTWIEGSRYFDLETDELMVMRDQMEKTSLIQKSLQFPDKDKGGDYEQHKHEYIEHSCGTGVVR
jgi:imidazolonepropionase-like amidohydrolase